MGENHTIQECTCNVEFPFSFFFICFLVDCKLNWDFILTGQTMNVINQLSTI